MSDQIAKAIETMDTLGQEYVEAMFTPVTNIYIDIRYIIDFDMTAALCLMTEADYGIIKKNVGTYNLRTRKGFLQYFKGVSFTEEQMQAYIKNPDKLLWASRLQYTSYLESFLDNLRNWNVRNHLNSKEPKPITVYIGYGGLPFPSMHRQFVVGKIQQYAPKAKVVITKEYIEDYPVMLIQNMQHLAIVDIETFCNHPKIMDQIKTGILNGRSLHSYPYVTDVDVKNGGELTFPNATDKDRLIRSDSFFNLFFDFEYVRAKVHHE